MNSQSKLAMIILLLATEIISAILPKTDCLTRCGNLSIPFPFGTTSDCCLDDTFLITCNHSYNPPKPFLNSGYIEVLEISLDGSMKVSSSVASDCYDDSGAQINGTISELTLSKFSISCTRNKFTVVGCDSYAIMVRSKDWKQMNAACVSWCDSINNVVNTTCSGSGCCQTSIPKGVKDFLVDIGSYSNHTRVKSFNPCGYAFVVEAEAFEFSSSDLKDLHNRKTFPVVLDWSVGNITCREARKNLSSYACRAMHSECNDSRNGFGYHCNCLKGFQGNPYLANGCQDIDGSGCHPRSPKSLFYIVSGLMVPALATWIYQKHKQKKVAKRRKNMSKRNGGLILENMLPIDTTFRVFTVEDLERATGNYDDTKILQKENHTGTSYTGEVPNQVKGIIKKLPPFEASDTKPFISKLVTLSRISHRNILKPIGCCLETRHPLLVYELISAKTLYDYIHDDDLARSLTWDVRLKIAAETAGALAYMHSTTANDGPVFHEHLTSSSILLHDNNCVKVYDFALTCPENHIRKLCRDENCYMQTTNCNVYSFGVVLAELLTGKIVRHPDDIPDFVSSPRGDDLRRVLDRRLVADGRIKQLTEVDELARRCLSSSLENRPAIKEVEDALIKSSTAIPPNSSPVTTASRLVRRNPSFKS